MSTELSTRLSLDPATVSIYIVAIKYTTVNSEIFARILFSRRALKDIFAMFKLRD